MSETVSLFHRLHAMADEIHKDLAVTAPLRGIMNSLARHGPKTVPQLARMRPVSRQHIQKTVNSLLAKGFVEYTDNPDHKRSRLVRLTDDGERFVRTMGDREERLLKKVSIGLDAGTLRRTAETLRRLREVFASREFRDLIRKDT